MSQKIDPDQYVLLLAKGYWLQVIVERKPSNPLYLPLAAPLRHLSITRLLRCGIEAVVKSPLKLVI